MKLMPHKLASAVVLSVAAAFGAVAQAQDVSAERISLAHQVSDCVVDNMEAGVSAYYAKLDAQLSDLPDQAARQALMADVQPIRDDAAMDRMLDELPVCLSQAGGIALDQIPPADQEGAFSSFLYGHVDGDALKASLYSHQESVVSAALDVYAGLVEKAAAPGNVKASVAAPNLP